jgi:hypothetical protein
MRQGVVQAKEGIPFLCQLQFGQRRGLVEFQEFLRRRK